MQSALYEAEHEAFRAMVRDFLAKEVVPHHAAWEEAGIVDRSVWLKAGEQGLLGMDVAEEYGGGGDRATSATTPSSPRRSRRVGASGLGFTLHNDVVGPYLNRAGHRRAEGRAGCPASCTGEIITAIAMSEPGAGSDLQGLRTTAVRDGDEWVLNGSKTFITNGILADLVIVVARTDPEAGARGLQPARRRARHARLRARPQPRQDRPEGPGHRRAVLRRRPRARREPARRARARASST